MKDRIIIFFLALVFVTPSKAAEYQLSLPSSLSEGQLNRLYSQYCGETKRLSTEIPKPNYSNKLVASVAEKLNTVAPVSFYMYAAVVAGYGFKRGRDDSFPWNSYGEIISDDENYEYGMSSGEEAQFSEELLKAKFDYEFYSSSNPAPYGVKGNSHAFLTYLCGEFRDRPTLIEAKLEWFNNLYKLPAKRQKPVIPSAGLKQIFSYLTAESYAPFVQFSRAAFDAREESIWGEQKHLELSLKWLVDKPVPAFSVCEIKYIITDYISQASDEQKRFPGFTAYQYGLDQYEDQYCSQDDKDHYYDFRGDSNIKPNSPESNGMIWYSTSIMNRCGRDENGRVFVRTVNVEGGRRELDFPLDECIAYMESPFQHRWNAARAGLATWLMRDTRHDPIFSSTYTDVTIVPHFKMSEYPAHFKMDGMSEIYDGEGLIDFLPAFVQNFRQYWQSPDLGFNSVFGVSEQAVLEMDLAYERLKDAVDRHTDWYASGYDDTSFEPNRARVINQAYSPFVASSYEMSESDGFVSPGTTVQGPRDGRRHWMFVFKVHKDRWYNTQSLLKGQPINFETDWIDETSFGTTQLADTERAWDRLGTPLEGEMEAVLYLHNIKAGTPIKNLSESEFPEIEDDDLGATH